MPGNQRWRQSPMNTERTEELLRVFNENAPIARYFRAKLSYADEANSVLSSPGQCALIDLPYNPNLDHAFGGIRGGVCATMLDNADVSGATFTAAAAHDVSCWMTASEMSVHFLLPARHTSLRAAGRLIRQGKASGCRGNVSVRRTRPLDRARRWNIHCPSTCAPLMRFSFANLPG